MSVRKTGHAEDLQWQAFSLPKDGSREEENEDAFSFSESRKPGTPFRAAVADGATEAAFSRRWAQLLAGGFTRQGADAFGAGLPDLRQTWQDAVDTRAEALPWYGAAKAADGAFATLLGLALRPDASSKKGGGAWQAASVGDCNLVHLRGGRLLRAWPRAEAEAFDDRPTLLASRSGASDPVPRRREDTYRPGDAFILATDAAAAWLLRTGPAQPLRWDDAAAFAKAAEDARSCGALKNDDTTVVVVEAK